MAFVNEGWWNTPLSFPIHPGDCYIVCAGVLSTTEGKQGYNEALNHHNPVESAAKVFSFAKDMMASSRIVSWVGFRAAKLKMQSSRHGKCISRSRCRMTEARWLYASAFTRVPASAGSLAPSCPSSHSSGTR